MRITVHLDTFACDDPTAFAILWIDTVTREWSREGHCGVDLPAWGTVRCGHGETAMSGADTGGDRCVLEGFDLDAKYEPFEGDAGRVRWYRFAHEMPVYGEWRVQWIDETTRTPEHAVFSRPDA